jgi:beta-1,4-mannosyl-glycoprotein beta-1,4-N-acetylglucosaminyltransferase
MIIDTFMFNDEFDMLDVRLEITKEYVDRWIILEGNRTWSGISKPFHLSNNFKKYKEKYGDKIQVIQLDIPEDYKDWVCENFSRASIQQGIDALSSNDIVIHSDLDEIINPDKFPDILQALDTHNKPISCQLEMYIYAFNLKTNRTWNGPIVARKSMIENPQKLYKGSQPKRKDRAHCFSYPENVGWHWTWIGDDARIKNKVISCIESQNRDPDQVLNAFKIGDTVSAINHKTATEKIQTDYPASVNAVIKQYSYWA